MAEWDSHQQARRSFGVLPSAAWPAAAHPPAHASQRPPADADRLETQGNAASTNDTHTTSAIGGRIAAAPAAASGGGGVPPAFPSSFHSSSLPSLPVLHPRSHPPAPSFFQASYRSGEPLSPQVAPSRTMPSFGLTARSALLRDEEHGGAGGESPAATAGATAINRRVGGGGGTGGSLSLRLHRRLLQCVGWLKSLTPLRWATVIGCLLLAVLVVRLLFGVYADRGKFDHFTIVSLMRDMSPDALAADKVSFAFQFTALASWARLVAAGNIIVFVEQADQCAHIQGLVRGVRCLAVPCVHATLHKPQLDCLFDAAHQLARTDIIAYVNSDVALYQDLGQAIATVAKQKDKFMMVGRRTNTLVSGVLLEDYRSPSFPDRLRLHAQRSGMLHTAFGIDLFVYRKRVLEQLKLSADDSQMKLPKPTAAGVVFPPFVAGMHRWDHWLLSQLILDDSVTVVDMTPSVLFVHQETGRVLHADKAVAAHNDELARKLSGTHYKVGTIDNAGFVLESSGALVVNPNVTDTVLFTKKASRDGYLVILTVNHNYIDLALNWVCWADRIKFTNFLLIAEDQSSATNFQRRNVGVIVRKDAPWIKKAGDYGSVEFQETMTFRTEFLMTVLTAGFHFVTADMDGLWLDDPLPYFNNAADLQGQMHKQTKISGGLVVVRATTWGRYFWNMVIECQRGNALFLEKATREGLKYVAATYTEQYCINELSRGLASEPLFSRSLLDPYIFPDGKSFFEEANSQYRGIWPAIIHNNWIVGTKNKIGRLHEWNLASAETATASECVALEELPFPHLPFVDRPPTPTVTYDKDHPRQLGLPPTPVVDPPPIPWKESAPWQFELKIRIFTSSNPLALKRCLASLAATDFESDGPKVSLEISIDHPGASPAESEVRGWTEVTHMANAFVWNAGVTSAAGEKIVYEQPYAIGPAGQFFRGWRPTSKTSDHELMLYVDDSAVLAPGWFKWLKRVVLQYAAHPSQFDPRLMGVSLNVQNLVLGETFVNRFAGEDASNQRNPFDLLNRRADYYKYQLFSAANTATLLFAQHWRVFLAWLDRHQVDTVTALSSLPDASAKFAPGGGPLTGPTPLTPCVPTIIANKWWREAPAQHWYQWLNRFTFEQGYFFLYTNFDQRMAFAIPGALMDKETQRRMARNNPPKLIEELTSVQLLLPSGRSIPVFDFHFNRVSTPDVLAWRQHIDRPSVIEQCWTIDRLAQKVADEEAAIEQARLEKVRLAEEKKLAAAAEKARLKAEKDAAKAAKDAEAKAAKEKKDADAKKAKATGDAAKKDDQKKDDKKADAKKDAKKEPKKDEKKSDKKPAQDDKKKAPADKKEDKKKPAAAATAAADKKKADDSKKKPPPPADE